MITHPLMSKIIIVVQSKYPAILNKFKESFFSTVVGHDVYLHEITGDEYGAKEINKILIPVLAKNKTYVFGVFNDDLIFSQGWLENCLDLLKSHECVSAGYVETEDEKIFQNAVEKTKDINYVIPFLYGPNAIFRTDIFRKVGIFDERFDWSVDDLDWAWRLKLNRMSSVTSAKITVCHKIGSTRTKNMKQWNAISKVNTHRFCDKHGYRSYRELRGEYKKNHRYFRQFIEV